MSNLEQDRTLALAALLQSACLANQLACTGRAPSEEFGVLLGSLFVFEPHTTADIFAGAAGVRLGLEAMDQLLSDGLASQAVALNYVRQLITLEKKLSKNKPLFTQLQQSLKKESERGASGDVALARRCRAIDEIYQQTISTLDFRIRLRGDPDQLAQLAVVERIRVTLLAGLRSCLLWRQLGGHFLQLVFQRQLHDGVRAWLRQLGAVAR